MTPTADQALQVDYLRVGPVTHLRVRGSIDERFVLERPGRELGGNVVLDLGQVDRIGHGGIRQWMNQTRALPRKTSGLYVVHAPSAIVDQLNMVEGFAGVARILSVMAPYQCRKCNEPRVRVVDARRHGAQLAAHSLPPHICQVCQTALELTEDPAEYFKYLRQNPITEIDPVLDKYLRLLAPNSAAEVVASSHVKIVEDDLTFVRVANVLKGESSFRSLTRGLEGIVVYDFGLVTAIDSATTDRVLEFLRTAAQSANVLLWRVPPVLLEVLSAAPSPPPVETVSLWVPSTCVNCGEHQPQRLRATEYLEELKRGQVSLRPCGICGGDSQPQAIDAARAFLATTATADAPYERLQEIEGQALSRSLKGLVENTPTPGSDPGRTETDPNLAASTLGTPASLQVVRRLGQGGMAEVFLARQKGLKGFERYVVLKKVLPQFAESQEFVEMLFSEARANARLTHPNIVQIFEAGMADGLAYIAMEYVRGPDLRRALVALRRTGMQLPVKYTLRIIADTAAGLHYAHEYVDPMGQHHPVIHRDVSPHNILLSLDGAIKLSDFGIAKAQDDNNQTRPGTFKGKVSYSSPEAVRCLPLDGRHDVFSLGIVMYECLTGQLPFRGDSDAATLRALVGDAPTDPSRLNPAVPERVAQIALKALEKDRDQRYATADDLRDDIEAAMFELGIRVTAKEVAGFLQKLLGEKLADFAPSAASTSPGSGSVSRPGSASGSGVVSRPGSASGSGSSASGRAVVSGVAELPPPLPAEPPTATASVPPPPPPLPRTQSVPTLPATVDVVLEETGPAPVVSQGEGEVLPQPRSKVWMFAAAAVMLAVAGGALGWMNRDTSAVKVVNLEAGSRLYVAGLNVDPALLQPTSAAVTVAEAQGGMLRRLGTLPIGSELDMLLLMEASAGPEQRAHLELAGPAPETCAVAVPGQPSVRAEGAISIPAGRELQVQVTCDGKPPFTRWVMAVQGQTVELNPALDGAVQAKLTP